MESLNPETLTVAVALLSTMVVGTTELIKRLFDRDYRSSAVIAGAAIVGGLGGVFVLPAVGFAMGIVIGISGSGLVTVAQNFGANKK